MRLRLLPLSCVLLPTAATAASPDLLGRWTGTLHTLQGACPDAAPSTLIVGAAQVSFAPADGVLVLRGARGRDRGKLHAQLSLPGIDHKPVPMVFEGHPDGRTIAGLYGTPSCRAEIRLKRPG